MTTPEYTKECLEVLNLHFTELRKRDEGVK